MSKRNDTGRANEPSTKVLSRSVRMLKPRVFKDGTTAAESPRHSSAEDDLSPMAIDMKERLEKPQGSRSSNDSRASHAAMGLQGCIGGLVGPGKKRKFPARTTGGGIFKAAAVQVLRDEARLMTTGEITKVALQRGYISCSGKTPDATMASALYTDIKRRSGETAFVRPKEGLFGLKEWHGSDTGIDVDIDIGSGVGCVERTAAPPGSVAPKVARARAEPVERAPPPVAFRMQDPADTTGSHCLAPPRDGLIDLLSAAEKVNGIEMSPAKQAGEWRQPDDQRHAVPHRRKMIMVANDYDKNDTWMGAAGAANGGNPDNKKENATVSMGEMGSIADPTKQENDSTELNNANGYMDRDHCVQSPRTRALSEVMPGHGAGLGENVGFQLGSIMGISMQLSEILNCVNSCPDDVQRSRGMAAVVELAKQLTPPPRMETQY